jgi:hypothetical protein
MTGNEKKKDAQPTKLGCICPVCGKHQFTHIDRFEGCPVCHWQDDAVQHKNPNYGGGANNMSLNEARKAYAEGRKVE